MQQIDEAAERSWSDFWPRKIYKWKLRGQKDIAETYKMMTGMYRDEEVEVLNVKTPEICSWK